MVPLFSDVSSQKLFFSKIDNITLDPDSNLAKFLDPDPNSMYLDPHNTVRGRVRKPGRTSVSGCVVHSDR